MMKVKDILKIKKGNKEELLDIIKNGSIRYIQIEDLRNNDNMKYCIPKAKSIFVEPTDIIIAWDGANAGTIGYGLSGVIGSTLAKMRIKKDEINSDYVAKYLQSKFKYLRDNCTGATIPHISRPVLENMIIPLPALQTQKKIVEVLDKAQELIDARKQQIKLLDDLIQSVFFDMFGDPVINPKEWKESAIKENVDFIDYRGKTPIKSSGGVLLITAKNVKFGYYSTHPEEFISDKIYNSIMTRGYPGINDVLFTTEGATLGNVCRIPRRFHKFAVGQRLITLVCRNQLISEYLHYCLIQDKIQNDILKLSTGSAAKGIRSKAFSKIRISIPPIDLQNKFAKTVQQIEQQKELMQQSLAEMENNFKNLMQRAFKGELFKTD